MNVPAAGARPVRHSKAGRYTGGRASRCGGAIAATLLSLGLITATPVTADDIYAVQLHIHGSFSEGLGSMHSMATQMQPDGVDVVWWSDHDWRVNTYRHASTFAFEDWSEPVWLNESWQPTQASENDAIKEVSLRSLLPNPVFRFSDAQSFDGSRSCELRGAGVQNGCQAAQVVFEADRKRFKRPLAAGIRITFAVLPETVGAGATAWLEATLSQHEATAEVAQRSQYRIRYVLGDDGVTRRDGATLIVPLPYTDGAWELLDVDISQDAQDGFPLIDAQDNSLFEVSFGLDSCARAPAAAWFDSFTIHQATPGDALPAVQANMLDDLALALPDMRQLQGVEISYLSPHLNAFTPTPVFYDYDALAAASGELVDGQIVNDAAYSRYVRETITADVHARGGLTSVNHVFGAGEGAPATSREDVLDDMLAKEAYDADIIELGYPDRAGYGVDDYTWVWDQLVAAGYFLIGTGVSDWHGGTWASEPNNFVSFVRADDDSPAALIAGLARGRVFFGEQSRFDGVLDIALGESARMGDIVLSARAEVTLDFDVAGAAAGDTLRVMANGAAVGDFAVGSGGPAPQLTLAVGDGLAVRTELLDDQAVGKAWSNHLHLVRSLEGIDPGDPRVIIEDADADGIADVTDNCTQSANPDQLDSDADGFGNACDGDLNNDLYVDFSDLAVFRELVFNGPSAGDLNGDGNTDFVDLELLKRAFFAPPGPSANVLP